MLVFLDRHSLLLFSLTFSSSRAKRFTPSPLQPTQTPSSNANMDVEKGHSKESSSDVNVTTTTSVAAPIYDPSKESRLTRMGLNLESFKRAPGTTG